MKKTNEHVIYDECQFIWILHPWTLLHISWNITTQRLADLQKEHECVTQTHACVSVRLHAHGRVSKGDGKNEREREKENKDAER